MQSQVRGMSDQGSEPRAQRLIVTERSRLTSVLRIITGLAYAVIVICAFAIIIARQHTIDSLREQVDDLAELQVEAAVGEAGLADCRSRFAADIAERQQAAANALHELVVLITRQVVAVTPPNRTQFEDAVGKLERMSADANDAVEARTAWIGSGSTLPCPLSRALGFRS
jgi:hypothetical protein